ncbi:MAG TPA: hypothetical protein GX718_05915 [Brevibacterium sp.]|nr:hypothetical protein [Brevibacterium sp.]
MSRHRRGEKRPLREYLAWYLREANSDFRLWVGTYFGVGGLLLLLLYGLVLRPLM